MSTALFLLVSLGLSLALGGLLLVTSLYVTPRLDLHRRRRLERRLSRRLGRGEDAYFEELRSIETALARPVTPALTLSGRLWLGASILVWGLPVARLMVPEDARPPWTRAAGGLLFVALGLQIASGVGRAPEYDGRGVRILGVLLIGLGLLFFAYDLSRVRRGFPA